MESFAKFLKNHNELSLRRRLLLSQYLKLSNPRTLDQAVLSVDEFTERKRKLKKKEKCVTKIKCGVDVPLNEEQEKIFKDSSAFLKGTQSENPHNDYCQHFIDTGERPQNFIRDVGLNNRFEEYPKLRELITKKDALIQQTNTPPMYLKCDLETFDLRDLEQKFDVILLEPPLEEYQRKLGASYDKYWSWDEIEKLQLEQVAAPRSFIWMWCGSSDGLDAGRKCLKKWGYRRCEDICWIETNKDSKGDKTVESKAIFQRTKEHCLMGIKGTVRRSTDGDFIHANVDIDLIIDEQPRDGSDEKPVEIFHIIEHFCLGRRRLHLFGRDTSIRPGWLTIGPKLSSSNYDRESYNGNFNKKPDGHLTGCTEEIERLRPKSPPPKNSIPLQQRNQSNNTSSLAAPSQTIMGPPSMINGGVMVPMLAAMIRNNNPQIPQPSPRHVIYQQHPMVRVNSWNTRPVNMAPGMGVMSGQWVQPLPSPVQHNPYNSYVQTAPPVFHLPR